MTTLSIRPDDLTSKPTRELLALHLRGMHETTPAEHVHALDLSGLQQPGVTVWSAWREASIAGIGALKLLGDGAAEIKSMRTHPAHLRQGVGAEILERIIAEARGRGIRRLLLETGRGEAFEAALALYRKRGFTSCGPFGDYVATEYNQFMALEL